MLTHLTLRNLALVERAEIEVDAGMTVLTGETGAGKSILIDALGLVIGERANINMLLAGADRAEVIAIFDLGDSPGPRAWLEERELDHENECILRRTIAGDGRSRAFINERPVPAQTLRGIGEMLVDIHGQHAHQSLLRRDTQRQILDDHGTHTKALRALKKAHARWQETRRALDQLDARGSDAESRLDFLNFQCEELASYEESLGDIEGLLLAHRRLSHGADIEKACAQSLERLHGEIGPAASDAIHAVLADLQAASAYDDALDEPIALLQDARAQVDEAAGSLRRYLANISTDREALARMDGQVSKLHELARKHRVQLEELPQTLATLRAEIEFLDSASQRETDLRQTLAADHANYLKAAEKLTKARTKAAKSLAGALEAQIRGLGMETGKAHVKLTPADDSRPTAHGLDVIEFEFSANSGAPLRPLAQVASGGELSRIGLAIQVIAANETSVGTFIFDEVDTGIGGRLADIVGARLSELGANRQVLCVTHLPQVASHAAQHLRVSKRDEQGVARTQVDSLGEQDRVQELARMLGGAEITERAIAHAKELLSGH